MTDTQMVLTWLRLFSVVETPEGRGTVTGLQSGIYEGTCELGVTAQVHLTKSGEVVDFDMLDLKPIL